MISNPWWIKWIVLCSLAPTWISTRLKLLVIHRKALKRRLTPLVDNLIRFSQRAFHNLWLSLKIFTMKRTWSWDNIEVAQKAFFIIQIHTTSKTALTSLSRVRTVPKRDHELSVLLPHQPTLCFIHSVCSYTYYYVLHQYFSAPLLRRFKFSFPNTQSKQKQKKWAAHETVFLNVSFSWKFSSQPKNKNQIFWYKNKSWDQLENSTFLTLK